MAPLQTTRTQWFRSATLVTVFAVSSFGVAVAQEPSELHANLPMAPSALIGPEAGNSQGTHVAAPDSASVSGTVEDANGALFPGAKVEADSAAPRNSRTVLAGDDGKFQLSELTPGDTYVIRVSADGAAPWTSQPIVLHPGQALTLDDIHLKVMVSDSITVSASRQQIATAQVQMETQQKTFGFIPNFYTVYDGDHAASLTTKLKFKLAMKTSANPVTISGVAFIAGVKQAGGTPNYQQGAAGYGQRFGATAATGFSDILIGGAILPSLLHQDPRYFYQGTGATRSRLMHALTQSFLIRGDNGKNQFNYSSIGGDLASSALELTYYPQSNRTAADFVGQFALATTYRTLNAVAQEFVFARFSTKAKFHEDSVEAALSDPQVEAPNQKAKRESKWHLRPRRSPHA